MALTDKQKCFIDTYCEALESGVSSAEAFKVAKLTAEYSENSSKRDILSDEVTQEILAYANRHMVMKVPHVLKKFDSLIDDPEQGGAAVLLSTINSFLDRGGVIKKEAKEITIKAPTGIVVMPAKVELDAE